MKKIILSISIVALIIISIIILNPFHKEIDTKYYIYMHDDTIPGGNYTLNMDEKGNCNLKVKNFSSAIGAESKEYNYNETLTQEEFSKVNKILNYINEKYQFDNQDNYLFYFDYSKDAETISRDDLEILLNTLSAIENILIGDELIDDQTSREFGNQWLDIIISKQLIKKI